MPDSPHLLYLIELLTQDNRRYVTCGGSFICMPDSQRCSIPTMLNAHTQQILPPTRPESQKRCPVAPIPLLQSKI